MKIISYNLNGIRASNKLNVFDWLKNENADVICLQEVRADEQICNDILQEKFNEYHIYYNCAEKKGYSGTITMSKMPAKQALFGFDGVDSEGRLITTVFEGFVIVNCYVPNGATRLAFKLNFMDKLVNYLLRLNKQFTNVFLCGDTNIAHKEVDVNKPKQVCKKSGFLIEERQFLDKILKSGFVDTYRLIHPNDVQYTWRSYKSRSASDDYGWKFRFDYIFCSGHIQNNVVSCSSPDLIFSDHLPVILEVV